MGGGAKYGYDNMGQKSEMRAARMREEDYISDGLRSKYKRTRRIMSLTSKAISRYL